MQVEELKHDAKTKRLFDQFLRKCESSQFGQVAIIAETRGGRIWRLTLESREAYLMNEDKKNN